LHEGQEITNQFGAPIDEALTHDVPHALMHLTCEATRRSVDEAVERHILERNDRQYTKLINRLGVVSVAAIGAITGADVLLGGVGAEQVIFLGAYSVFLGNNLRLRMKSALRHQRELMPLARQAGAVTGFMVAGAVHNTFCTDHFDRQAEEMLPDDDEPSESD
jgi:hypothetical protein